MFSKNGKLIQHCTKSLKTSEVIFQQISTRQGDETVNFWSREIKGCL